MLVGPSSWAHQAPDLHTSIGVVAGECVGEPNACFCRVFQVRLARALPRLMTRCLRCIRVTAPCRTLVNGVPLCILRIASALARAAPPWDFRVTASCRTLVDGVPPWTLHAASALVRGAPPWDFRITASLQPLVDVVPPWTLRAASALARGAPPWDFRVTASRPPLVNGVPPWTLRAASALARAAPPWDFRVTVSRQPLVDGVPPWTLYAASALARAAPSWDFRVTAFVGPWSTECHLEPCAPLPLSRGLLPLGSSGLPHLVGPVRLERRPVWASLGCCFQLLQCPVSTDGDRAAFRRVLP